MRRRAVRVAICLTVLAGGCSARGDRAAGDDAPRLAIAAEDIAFVPDDLRAEPGPLVIEYTNRDGVPHNLLLEDADGNVVVSSGNPTAEAGPVQLVVKGGVKVGEYAVICAIHPSMTSALRVG